MNSRQDDATDASFIPRHEVAPFGSFVLGTLAFCLAPLRYLVGSGLVSAILSVAALGLGALSFPGKRASRKRTRLWMPLAGIGFGGAALVLVFWIFPSLRVESDILTSKGKLKNIALALANYQDAHGSFPPAFLCDADGNPLLSWRVLLLPYLMEQDLYEQFKLEEAWDGPNNKRLLNRMPAIYGLDSPVQHDPYTSFYQVFVGSQAAFEPCQGVSIGEFLDGPANTVLVIEAGEAVPWTKPQDLRYSPAEPIPRVGGHFAGRCNFASADYTVRSFTKTANEQLVRKWITRNGREPLFESESDVPQ